MDWMPLPHFGKIKIVCIMNGKYEEGNVNYIFIVLYVFDDLTVD